MSAEYQVRHSDEFGSADQEHVQHEESDVNVRAILGFAAALLLVAVVVHLAVWGLFRYFEGREAIGVREFPLAVGEPQLPPEPRLQSAPRLDMNDLLMRETEVLNGYSWSDREAGVVRMPIEEAMKRTLERGLPARGVTGDAPK